MRDLERGSSQKLSLIRLAVGPQATFSQEEGFLWEHNLRCPVCARHLIADYRQNRMRFFSLPESRVCESCGAHLKFTK